MIKLFLFSDFQIMVGYDTENFYNDALDMAAKKQTKITDSRTMSKHEFITKQNKFCKDGSVNMMFFFIQA